MSYLTGHWSFDPFLVVVAVVVAGPRDRGWPGCGRVRTPRRTRRRRRRSLLFYAGLACLLVAVESPIDYWSDDYFFVHMIEHILISFYAPILIVAGAPWIPLLFALPVGLRRRLVRSVLLGPGHRPLRAVGRADQEPVDGTGRLQRGHGALAPPRAVRPGREQPGSCTSGSCTASFLVTGVLFWLQIIPSHPMRPRASLFWQGGAIIATNVVMFVLAMSLSIFSSASWYSVYAHVPGGDAVPRSPTSRSGRPSCGCAGTSGPYPALIVVIRRAIVEEGGLSNVLERMVHRLPSAAAGPGRRSLTTADTGPSVCRRAGDGAQVSGVRHVYGQSRGGDDGGRGRVCPGTEGADHGPRRATGHRRCSVRRGGRPRRLHGHGFPALVAADRRLHRRPPGRTRSTSPCRPSARSASVPTRPGCRT